MSEMFLYTVKPRRTIIGLSGSVKVVRTNKSLYLTKEDVLLCLKSATVYRRFANEGINERVTIDDVDRVHRENYIPASEWEAFCAMEKSKVHGTVVDPVVPPVEDEKEETVNPENDKEEKSDQEKTVVINESEHPEEVSENVTENNDVENTLPVDDAIVTASEAVEEGTAETSQDDEDDTAVESDDDEVVEKAE